MSEYIEKMIEEKANQLKRGLEKELEEFVASLQRKVNIMIPTDVPRILARGGTVERRIVNLPYSEAYLSLQMGDTNVFYDKEKGSPMFIDSGKYRVTLIVERIGDPDHTKGAKVAVKTT